jgi:gliding motility-associated-like protein
VLFTVTVTDASGCKATDGVLVRSIGGGTIHVPNAFSPGGDGLNEVFRPIPAGIVLASMHFRVFNRYGALMFETNRSMHGWDGRYKGEAQPGGNYVWQLQAKTANGKLIEMKGNVVLIR